MHLTVISDSVMELNYVQTGLASVKLGDILFTSPQAGRDILESARRFMEQNDSWVRIRFPACQPQRLKF